MSRTMCCDHACTHTCTPPALEPRGLGTNVGTFHQCTCGELWTVAELTTGIAWVKADLIWKDTDGNLLAHPRQTPRPEGRP